MKQNKFIHFPYSGKSRFTYIRHCCYLAMRKKILYVVPDKKEKSHIVELVNIIMRDTWPIGLRVRTIEELEQNKPTFKITGGDIDNG